MCEQSQQYWSDSKIEFVIKGEEERTFVVDRPYAMLGSDQDCDVALDAPRIPRKAMLFVATHRGLRVLMLSAHSKRAGQRLRVEPDQPIRLGKFEISARIVRGEEQLSNANQQDPCDESTIFMATWQSKDERRFLQFRNELPVLVGRKRPSHLRIEDERISGRHCVLFRVAETLWVIDLQSANGTKVASNAVMCGSLNAGDSIQVGSQRIHFVRLYTDQKVDSIEASLKEELNKAKRETRIANLREATSLDALAALEAKERSNQSQLEQAELNTRRLEAEALDLRLEMSHTETELTSCRLERDQLNAKLNESTKASNDLRAQLEQEAARSESLERELSDAKELLNDNDALRDRELKLEGMQRELALERQILHELQLGVAPQIDGAAEGSSDEESCISPFDFQDVLEEALEGLPSIEED